MGIILFHILINLSVSKRLYMRLINVVMTCLYGSIDYNICMKVFERFKLLKTNSTNPRSMYLIKLQ